MDAVDLERLKSQKEKCKTFCVGFITFTIHFLLVMGLLVAGSFVFIELEEKDDEETSGANKTRINNFPKIIENITERFLKTQNVSEFLSSIKENSLCSVTTEDKKLSKYEKFLKWFHFGNVVGTTIGYGNVVPVTDKGRLFFIAYAIFIIPAMLTLLARCGDIMTTVNKLIFKLMRKYCFKKSGFMSDALLSAVSLGLQFIGYMHLLYIWPSLRDGSWTYIEYIYFWFVTFTTIGFGDLSYEIDDYEYVLTVYRLFGLALLAGLIDSIVLYARERREKLKKVQKLMKQQTMLAREKMKDLAEKQSPEKASKRSSKAKRQDVSPVANKYNGDKNTLDNPSYTNDTDESFHMDYGVYKPSDDIW